ncbi:hypothetical protein RE628_11365 [Paenibacillus sp. D2_2]|uniref:hypothetical protein n=1 Tax=Paenibacillus sp. D2_2 TaxID=3073092 RepID=UPI0028151D62|nr:hypothetical protein [Paenibacillus sp. D2_2]WMT42826.1 hypothetical protein RE628_11365 [Paenibacillus sp. D2_2]
MTELDLYKFVSEQEREWRGDKLIMWLYPSDLTEFANLLGGNYLSEGGTEVRLLTGGMIGVELNEICEDFDIDPERIATKDQD